MLVMLYPQMYTWYVFYYLPKSFNVSLLGTHHLVLTDSVQDEKVEQVLLNEMGENLDPTFSTPKYKFSSKDEMSRNGSEAGIVSINPSLVDRNGEQTQYT
mmetsp:Transcript_31605/g.23439  ORF Transcript_31605/g.23439 Transcript_31605/m.23439 type:complete len:100 (-) Transcript_31605:119-418(-)